MMAVGSYENPGGGGGGGHCLLNGVLHGRIFPGNQDVAVKYKFEVIYVTFW